MQREDPQKLRVRCACGAELELEDRSPYNRREWFQESLEIFYQKHAACLAPLETKKD